MDKGEKVDEWILNLLLRRSFFPFVGVLHTYVVQTVSGASCLSALGVLFSVPLIIGHVIG